MALLLPGEANAAQEEQVQVTLTISPLAIKLDIPKVLYVGDHFLVKADIRNLGNERITDAIATIFIGNKGLRLNDHSATKRLGTIPPHKEKTAVWSLEALKKGKYIILVTASGKSSLGELTAQKSVIVTVKERHHGFWGFFRWWDD